MGAPAGGRCLPPHPLHAICLHSLMTFRLSRGAPSPLYPAAVSGYSIVCMPQRCNVLVRRGRRQLLAAAAEVSPGCNPAHTMKASGLGTKIKGSNAVRARVTLASGGLVELPQMGRKNPTCSGRFVLPCPSSWAPLTLAPRAPVPLQLLFKLPFPALTGYAAYKCVATAANVRGWGATSAVKPTLLPPRWAPACPAVSPSALPGRPPLHCSLPLLPACPPFLLPSPSGSPPQPPKLHPHRCGCGLQQRQRCGGDGQEAASQRR